MTGKNSGITRLTYFANEASTANLQKAGIVKLQETREIALKFPAGEDKPDYQNIKTPKAPSAENGKVIPYRTSTFQYDKQGNLLREERKTKESTQESLYTYDGFNRQKKIRTFDNKVQVNHYDGEGLRHEMEENGQLVKFLYADREAIAEEKEDGSIIRFLRGYDLVASDSESARTYYHYASDEQGSITHVLGEDETGEYSLKNYYEYGAFGDFREQYEEVENRFGYNREIFDPIGGQYYLKARDYNPVIGRFTQEDSYYGDGLNLYAYCRNLPVGYEDPSGHYPCKEKLDLYKKYREQGLSKKEADIKSNYDLIKKNQGKKAAKKYLNNERVKQRLIASGMTPKQANDYLRRKPKQIHHFATNKSKKYTKQFERIAKKYGLKLDDKWNKQLLPHQGRHPYEYHEYVLDSMRKIDAIAQGDTAKFLKLYDKMKQKIIKHLEMLYKNYWKNH